MKKIVRSIAALMLATMIVVMPVSAYEIIAYDDTPAVQPFKWKPGVPAPQPEGE